MRTITINLEKGQYLITPNWSRLVIQKKTFGDLDLPADLSGSFYDKLTGLYLGTSGAKPGEKVYAATTGEVSRNPDGSNHIELSDIEDLKTKHTQFQSDASTVYGESSAFKKTWQGTDELAFEMAAIAYIYTYRNRVAFGINSDKAKEFRNTKITKRTGDMAKAVWSLINAVRDVSDYSGGAKQWDGPEQAMYDESVKTIHPPDHPNWILHMNDSGWRISDEHYNKWKKNVGSIFKAPQVRTATDGPNKGKIRLESTAVYARSIFWKVL